MYNNETLFNIYCKVGRIPDEFCGSLNGVEGKGVDAIGVEGITLLGLAPVIAEGIIDGFSKDIFFYFNYLK